MKKEKENSTKQVKRSENRKNIHRSWYSSVSGCNSNHV